MKRFAVWILGIALVLLFSERGSGVLQLPDPQTWATENCSGEISLCTASAKTAAADIAEANSLYNLPSVPRVNAPTRTQLPPRVFAPVAIVAYWQSTLYDNSQLQPPHSVPHRPAASLRSVDYHVFALRKILV